MNRKNIDDQVAVKLDISKDNTKETIFLNLNSQETSKRDLKKREHQKALNIK